MSEERMSYFHKQELREPKCEDWACVERATHRVTDLSWRVIGQYCEKHADIQIAVRDAYEEVVSPSQCVERADGR